jgi:hypothetical protein
MSKNYKDRELKRAIKEMEDKLRQEAAPAASNPEDIDNKVSFDQWWVMIHSKVSMRPHYKEILLVDFQARGLTKLETEQRYNDTLRVFGINW